MSTAVRSSEDALAGTVERVGVIGGGIMGSGIAEVAARSGCDVVLREVSEAAAENGLARIRKSLARAVNAGQADRRRPRGRAAAGCRGHRPTSPSSPTGTSWSRPSIEDEAEKVGDLPGAGQGRRARTALLASNTSSIPIMKLAAVTPQPQRVIGMHFFNPVPVLPLVELVPSLLTVTGDRRARRAPSPRASSASTRCCARTAPASSSTRC